MNRCKRILLISMVVGLSLLGTGKTEEVKAAQKIKVGQRQKLSLKNKNATFKSSDTTIASVNAEGIVTGKKAGTVKVAISTKGKKVKKITIKVKENTAYPVLPVVLDEITTEETMKQDAKGNYWYGLRIKNNAKKGTIKKIVYTYEIQEKKVITTTKPASPAAITTTSTVFKKKIVSIESRKIKAGKTSAWLQCAGDCSGDMTKMKLKKVLLYTGKACYSYDAEKNKYALSWGVPDKKAPVISGWVKKNSFCNGEAYLICYSDKKNTYHFQDYIKVKDDRGGKCSVQVDTGKVNWEKSGFYKVYYTAKDKAGNKAVSWMKIQVIVPGTAESVADSVLKSIIKTSWSDKKKIEAIYDYTRKHCSYVDMNSHSNWRDTGLAGLRYSSGDCFTYYSVGRLLLSRAGIPNLTVQRYPSYENGHHWWSLVYLKGGWYHFDTTPRQSGGRFCLNTDKQLWTYSSGSTFRFQTSKYPKRATKVISPTPRRDKKQR